MMTRNQIAAVSVLIALAGSASGETLYGPLQGNTLQLADHMVSIRVVAIFIINVLCRNSKALHRRLQ